MTVQELAEALSSRIEGGEDLSREITGGYCGDLLSWVMGRAKSGDAWITIMGNINSIAVATLADVACIVLAENAPLEEDALLRAKQQDIPILRSELPAYEIACRLFQALPV